MHLQLENLHKSYLDGEGRTLHILRGVDLRLEQPGQTAHFSVSSTPAGFQCAGERDDARIGSGTEPQSESQACE